MSVKELPSVLHRSLPQMVQPSNNSRRAVSRYQSNKSDEGTTVNLISESENSSTPQVIEINSSRSNSPFPNTIPSHKDSTNSVNDESVSDQSKQPSEPEENSEDVDEDQGSKLAETMSDRTSRLITIKRDSTDETDMDHEESNKSNNLCDVKNTSDVLQLVSSHTDYPGNQSNESHNPNNISLNKRSENYKSLDDIIFKKTPVLSLPGLIGNIFVNPTDLPEKSDESETTEPANIKLELPHETSPKSGSSENSPESTTRRTPRKQDNPLKRLNCEDSISESCSPKVKRRLLNGSDFEDSPSSESSKKSSRYGREQRQRSMGPDMKLLPIVNRHKPRTVDNSGKKSRPPFVPKKVIGTGDFVVRLLEDLLSKMETPLPGDLFWSRIPGHPYWPCMISLDPIKGQYRKYMKGFNKGLVFHVQYFGKDTQRGWTVPNGIIPFRGQRHFELLVRDLTEKTPEGPDREYIAFQFKVNPKRLSNWNIAIEEAEEAFGMSREQRNKELTFEYQMPSGRTFIPLAEGVIIGPSKNKKTENETPGKKRGRPKKSVLQDISSNEKTVSVKAKTSIGKGDPETPNTSLVDSFSSTPKRGRGRPRKVILSADPVGLPLISSPSKQDSNSAISSPLKPSPPKMVKQGVNKEGVTSTPPMLNSLKKDKKRTLGIRLKTNQRALDNLASKLSKKSTAKITNYFQTSPKVLNAETVMPKSPKSKVGSFAKREIELGSTGIIKTEIVSPVKKAQNESQSSHEILSTTSESSNKKHSNNNSGHLESIVKSEVTSPLNKTKNETLNNGKTTLIASNDSKKEEFSSFPNSGSKSVDNENSNESQCQSQLIKGNSMESKTVVNQSSASNLFDNEDSDSLEVVFVNLTPKSKKRRKKKTVHETSEILLLKNENAKDPNENQQKFNANALSKASLVMGESTNLSSSKAEVLASEKVDVTSGNERTESALFLSESSNDKCDSPALLLAAKSTQGDMKGESDQGVNIVSISAASPRRSSRAPKPKTPPEDFVEGKRKNRRSLKNSSTSLEVPPVEKVSATEKKKQRVIRALDMDCESSTILEESPIIKRKSQRACNVKKETEETDSDYVPEEEKEKTVSPLKKPKNAQKSKGAFSAFADKHLVQYRKQYPSFSEKELETYMFHEWENLPEHMKSTYTLHFGNTSTAKKPPTLATSQTQRVTDCTVNEDPTDKSSEEVDTENEESDSTCSSQNPEYRDGVCAKCEKQGELICCLGECNQLFHLKCLETTGTPYNTCIECATGEHTCFKCKKKDGAVSKCPVPSCGKFYHPSCLQGPQVSSKPDLNKHCPLHSCLTCSLNKPKGVALRKARLKRCVRCPVAYHSGDGCLAAGCVSLSLYSILCPNHFSPKKGNTYHSHISTSWCFICSVGGELICCESCPAAYHPECLEIVPPEDSFFCSDCTAGKHPCYGDIVWVKLGSYRWWPAEIRQASTVPQNIQNLPHAVGQFPVEFFGSHDYFWIHRGRVFLFHEGDKGSVYESSRHLAKVFQKAVTEATEAFQKLASVKLSREIQSKSKRPPPYKHIKTNRPVGKVQLYMGDEASLNSCECEPTMTNPCGMDSQCLNRMLMVECHPSICPAKEACQNQMFVKRQNAPAAPILAEGRGWGLYATADIKKGSFVAEYVGELIDEEECQRRLQQKHQDNDSNFYFLTLDKDRIIDAGPKGNLSRFMNHSCKPNCESQKWTVNGDARVGLFAIIDIPSGCELTFNYHLDCYGNEKTKCACGSDNCSGYIGVRPKTMAAMVQERKAKESKENGNKKRKQSKAQQTPKHEDECFRCLGGGELMMCDRKGCTKAYHLNCLSLVKPPYGRWECPWHHCDECGQKATLLCSHCPNSYCKEHGTKENIVLMGDTLLECKEHWENDSVTEIIQTNIDCKVEPETDDS